MSAIANNVTINEDKISVVIPVYNVEDYVENAIRSITEQTYKNIEIIVVDDYSSDNTLEIVTAVSEKDERVKVFKNKSNLGIAETLNYAISKSNGKYIARMDGDDLCDNDRIMVQYNYLQNNKWCDLVGTSVKLIDKNGEFLGYKKMHSCYRYNEIIKKYQSPVLHIWMCKKEVYKILGGYRCVPGCEDYDFLLRLQLLGKRYSNVSEYYGYSVRVFRKGNTVSLMGFDQRWYFRKIYNEYKKITAGNVHCFDVPSVNNSRVLGFARYMFRMSLHYRQKSGINKKKLKYYFYKIISLLLYPPIFLNYLELLYVKFVEAYLKKIICK